MYIAYPVFVSNATTDAVVVGVASAAFPNAVLAANQTWLFTSSTACWIKQGTAPTASAAAGSMFVPAAYPVFINGGNGPGLAVIQDAAGGKASLVKVQL